MAAVDEVDQQSAGDRGGASEHSAGDRGGASGAASGTSPTAPSSSLWRDRDFVVLLAGETISGLGSQITLFALPMTAVLVLHASGGQIGALKMLFTLPYFLLPLVVGVLMDRYPRRPAMLAANAARALLVLSIPVVAWTGQLTMTQLFIVALLGGSCSVLFDIAYSSYIPTLVGRARLSQANSLLQTGYSAAFLSGPGVAGLLISWVGAASALVVDAVSYLVSFSTISSIRARERSPAAGRERKHAVVEAREGITALFKIAPIRQIAIHACIYNGSVQFIEIAFLIYALNIKQIGSAAFGLAIMIGGVGGLLGALNSARLTRRLGLGPAMLTAVTLETSVFFLLPVAGGGTAVITALFGLTFFVAGLGAGVANAVVATVRQGFTPDPLMARVGAGYRMMNLGVIPIGAGIGGILVTVIGVHATLWITPFFLISSGIPLVFTSFRRLRAQPTAAELDEMYHRLTAPTSRPVSAAPAVADAD